ncbi:hypothetical protein AWB66_02136 [Caballeronia telluris]|uniref:Uncharacterized protein n=1 Tax=Caballeronia telluris TaxID=326475 RepID=A0A158HAF2_9BURK|nr:hypothetical protein AWB66_02136 [Caballeronia telluris]
MLLQNSKQAKVDAVEGEFMHFCFLEWPLGEILVHELGFATASYEILFCHLEYTLGAARERGVG